MSYQRVVAQFGSVSHSFQNCDADTNCISILILIKDMTYLLLGKRKKKGWLYKIQNEK